MKKIIFILSIFICFASITTACDKLGKEFWNDTATKAETIFGIEEGNFVNQNFKTIYNITYIDEINQIVAAPYGAEFKELTEVYAPLFESAVSFAKDYYADLKIIPKNQNNQFKGAIKQINKKLDTFEKMVNNFAQEKQDYESWLERQAEGKSLEEVAASDQQIARLVLYKRDYVSLIKSAYNLSESIFEARRIGYYNFSDYSNEELVLEDEWADVMLAINASNLEIIDCAVDIISEYNANNIASDYENYWTVAKDYYLNIVKEYKAGKLTVAENVKDKLLVWSTAFNMFRQEKQEFNTVLQKINLKTLTKLGNNASAYANETGNAEMEIYANYYLKFHEKITVLKNYSQTLFA